MKFHRLIFITLLFFVNTVLTNGHRNSHRKLQEYNDFGITKLFVFGDSYADTGNKHFMWKKEPYGISYTGKPSGRYSDGLVLTDYLAKFLGMKTPVPYHWRKFLKTRLHYGMNFAVGGAGVFDTLIPAANISTQIDWFEQLINDSVYTKYDLQSSLVLIAISGNDYDAANESGASALEIIDQFVDKLVNQLALDVKRISNFGAKRIAVGSLPPLGCLPTLTEPLSYQECNDTATMLSTVHKSLLNYTLGKLNNESLATTYTMVDLFDTFNTTVNNQGHSTGNLKFPTPLKPCCMGIGGYSCGALNTNGEKMYTVCKNPESSFFWDSVHPTQAGWKAVFTDLQPTFEEICSFT